MNLEQLKSFQKVYVDEIGKDAYMDPSGNLYDENGAFLGQADADIENYDQDNDISNPGIKEMTNLNKVGKDYLTTCHKVYVEELGQNVFMDQTGNLYDIDGNFLGQAEEDNILNEPAE